MVVRDRMGDVGGKTVVRRLDDISAAIGSAPKTSDTFVVDVSALKMPCSTGAETNGFYKVSSAGGSVGLVC